MWLVIFMAVCTVENKFQLRKCLEGQMDFDELIVKTITKYKKRSGLINELYL